MIDLAEVIGVERDGLRDMLERVALERENDARAARDHRFSEAAASIRRIGATLHQVDDATLLVLSGLNETADGLLSELIVRRLVAVGFELPSYRNAADFFAPFIETVDAVLRRARLRMH